MMKSMSQYGLTVLELLSILAIVAILGLAIIGPFYFCPQRWAQSGLSAEFHFGAGCMVKRKDGTIVPEKAIRDMNL